MSLLAIIVIIVLLAAFIYMWAKCQSLQKEVHLKENKENELKKLALVLQNINAYFLLIYKDFVVCDTNYYSLNRLPIQVGGVTKRVGDLLHCRNAIAAGECGQHEQCKLCCIRASIGKAFYKKASFKNLEASMKLLSEDETKVTPCDVSVSGTYLNIHGEDYMVLTVYDVTELKNAQRLLSIEREHSISADKLKSAFLANISHEIRTPLNAIIGFSSILAMTEDEEEKKEYVSIIEKNNGILLQLINDVLDLSKIEAGVLDLYYSEFGLNGVLATLKGVVESRLQDRVDLIFEPGMPDDYVVYSEKNRLQQLVLNFLTNACKFTSTGSIRYGYEVRDKDIYYYVTDTGTGIPEDKLHLIFERFIKLDSFKQGTGLGLPICQLIIQNMGGEIGVNSKLGEGSTFWFTLPLKPKQ